MKRISTGLSGRVRISVLQEGRVVEERDWQKNLILDQGLDMVATTVFNQCFSSCCAGTDTTVNDIDSLSAAMISGQTLTIDSGPYQFSSIDLDSNAYFDGSGQSFKIQSIVSPTQVTLFTSGSVAPGSHFRILRVNEAELGSEVKRTSIYSQTPGANQGVASPGQLQLQRTFLFPAETSDITYAELGFSNLPTAGANLFSRVVLAAPVKVLGPSAAAPGGQQLQVTYQLNIQIDYGRGPGAFFSGTTPTFIETTGLPVLYSIWQYANSTNPPGQLQIYVTPVMTVGIGAEVTITNSTVPAYNGVWKVLATQGYSDSTHGQSTILTLNALYTQPPGPNDQGTVAVAQTGEFFRPCLGIFWISQSGGSVAQPGMPDVFQGDGEPSVASGAWLSPDTASTLGSNGVAVRPSSPTLQSVLCSLLPYTNGNYYIDKKAAFVIETGQSPISSFGVGQPDATDQIETWTWDQSQAMAAAATFTVVFRFSWARTSY